MDKPQPSDGPVVAIESIGKVEEFGPDMVQTGDVVEDIRISGSPVVKAPFKGGKAAVQKILHAAFKRGDTSVVVKIRRGLLGPNRERKELQACLVPQGKRNYILRSIYDPNHTVGFADRTESECIALQVHINKNFQESEVQNIKPAFTNLLYYLTNKESRSTRLVSELTKAHVQDGFASYPWEKKMNSKSLSYNHLTGGGGSFLSILILPKALDSTSSRYDTIEETMGRAHSWLLSARKSGVPITFVNIQTEALLTKISGETTSATVNCINDLSNITNLSLYGFEDYHGVDLGVVKAVRLWYRATGEEVPLEIKLNQYDTRLGFAVSRTDEGFIYISSVEEDNKEGEAPSTRCGLRDLYKLAKAASQLLIISRIANEKVLPWMVCSTGSIRCYDTISLSQKLSLHRKALFPFSIHLLLWDKPVNSAVENSDGRRTDRAPATSAEEPAEAVPSDPLSNELEEETESMGRESVGDVSFRFEDVILPRSWFEGAMDEENLEEARKVYIKKIERQLDSCPKALFPTAIQEKSLQEVLQHIIGLASSKEPSEIKVIDFAIFRVLFNGYGERNGGRWMGCWSDRGIEEGGGDNSEIEGDRLCK
ncbi:Cobyric acid synthase [Rhynchospora pubera]|uniref:Cobyric acid synthase n=1 Tax=Rhynchospora pubera TaxID=906938 RepID=A0AAV8H166_9POAL|nr:Cobyric acid synthase [Rhynchospora pubera]